MASFCGKCGSPLSDQAGFCGGCGAPVTARAQTVTQTAPSAVTNGFGPVSAGPAPTFAAAPVKKSSNSLLKLGIVLVVIIFVGGLAAFAAVYYAAHKVSEKIHSATEQALGGNTTGEDGKPSVVSQSGGDAAGPGGDLCRFLSPEDVSAATGAKVIRAESAPDGCAYIAKGDMADVLSKHMGGLLTQKGADPKSKQMLQNIAGGFFKQQEQSDKNLSAQSKTGEVPVLTISFSTSGHGVSEMKLNRKLMGNLGAKDMPGIGDEAFDSADGILTVRKGETMFRVTYVSCPCSTEAVTPLAQKIASAL